MEIKEKIAVITGGASGIGRGIVRALVTAGAKGIVIADIDSDRASAVAEEVRAGGVDAEAYTCDVSSEDAVEGLADFVWKRFGGVDLLFANAGVVASGNPFAATENDTRWEFDANIFGVIHCCRVFGRRFLAAGHRGYICVTSSHNALGAPYPDVSGYVATKHASLGYVDALHSQFGEKIGFSVLCPGPINTAVWDAGRARPARFGGPVKGNAENAEYLKAYGMDPDLVGTKVIDGIRHEDFFIITHPEDIALPYKRYQEVKAAIRRQFPDFTLPA
jgi:NAD(P)-dependent dehydrogenase (short-subunit alcohol dehydrogenase family)